MGMHDNDFINLPELEMEQALWQLSFSPTITLEERSVPFQLISDDTVLEETTGYISALGLMIPMPSNTYTLLYYSTFTQNMPLTMLLSDGTTRTLYINSVDGYTRADHQTGKTKFLFSEFVDISAIRGISLTLP